MAIFGKLSFRYLTLQIKLRSLSRRLIKFNIITIIIIIIIIIIILLLLLLLLLLLFLPRKENNTRKQFPGSEQGHPLRSFGRHWFAFEDRG